MVLSLVCDLAEESDDDYAPEKEIVPPEFIRLAAERAGELLPKEDNCHIKLWLLSSLYNSEADVLEQFRSLNIRANIHSGWVDDIPHHGTGTFVDTNVDEDIVRPLRYN